MKMKVTFSLNETQLKELVRDHFAEKTGLDIKVDAIDFRVKSKNNYRAQEWEQGEFKVTYEGDV